MRAVVLTRPRHLEVQELPRPAPSARDVLVRPQSIGLCGADFHIHAGAANYHRDARGAPVPLEVAPQISGHEITGVVEELGAEVSDLRPGLRVVLDQGLNCKSFAREALCEHCRTGDSHPRIESDLELALAEVTEPLACVLHSADMIERAPDALRPGERRYGHGHEGVGMELLNQVQWSEPTLLSPVGASGGFDPDGRPSVYRRALRMLEADSIDVESLVTHRYDGLHSIPRAFAGERAQPGYVKGVALL